MKKVIGILTAFIIILGTIAFVSASSPHWTKRNISVFIPKNDQSSQMQQAFSAWQTALKNRISFTFTEQEPADINITYKDQISGSDGNNIGEYNLTTSGDVITSAEISIIKTNKTYSPELVYAIMLHEIGHCLGLFDLKGNSNGIMYLPVKPNSSINPMAIKRLHAIYRNTDILK